MFVLRYALLFFFFRDCFLQDVCVLGFFGRLGVQVIFVYMFFGCSRHIVLCICLRCMLLDTPCFLMSNCRIFLLVVGRYGVLFFLRYLLLGWDMYTHAGGSFFGIFVQGFCSLVGLI